MSFPVFICRRYRQGLCKVREVRGRGRGVKAGEEKEGKTANCSGGKEPCKWMLSSAESGYAK